MPPTPDNDLQVIEALNALWSAIRVENPRVLPATFDLKAARPSSCSSVAWFTNPVIVLTLTGGEEHTPVREVLFDLLHQAAHAVTYRPTAAAEGRYHDLPLGQAAEDLGLVVNHQRTPGLGYAVQGLARGTLTRYEKPLARLDRALAAWEPVVLRKRSRGAQTFVCGCDPPRRMMMSPGVADRGTVTCGVCGEAFRPTT